MEIKFVDASVRLSACRTKLRASVHRPACRTKLREKNAFRGKKTARKYREISAAANVDGPAAVTTSATAAMVV